MIPAGDDALVARLERARDLGYFGPGPVLAHLTHARGFGEVAERVFGHRPGRAVDLGSGGGVPGLVLAWDWPVSTWVLVDAGQRRAADLEAAVADLGLADRVRVRNARAEVVAHESEHREQAELVTARSFAAPAVTAEIAAGLVVVGGWVVVSEPPGGDPSRWPEAGLAALGLGAAQVSVVDGRTYAALPKVRPAPAAVPRSTRRLVKRPAWQ